MLEVLGPSTAVVRRTIDDSGKEEHQICGGNWEVTVRVAEGLTVDR
ncbi:hypothetical protein A2U01_0069692, partial [Trifolium medium]|nr:hypothetical protein [Trifolium medium]